MIRIFWDDLTQSKQKEILVAFGGEDGNFFAFYVNFTTLLSRCH